MTTPNAPPLTREQLDRLSSFAHADDGERAALYGLLDDRDSWRRQAEAEAECAERITADRDRLARENAELRQANDLLAAVAERTGVERDTARAEVENWKAKYKALASVDVLELRNERDDLRHRVAESAARIATLEAILLRRGCEERRTAGDMGCMIETPIDPCETCAALAGGGGA